MKLLHPPCCPFNRSIQIGRWLAVGIFATWAVFALMH